MAKVVITYNGATLGSSGTNGSQAPVFTAAQNANGTVPKDPRK